MSTIDSWVFNSLTLKHLAKVKTVQLLWRKTAAGEVKEIHNNMVQGREGYKCPLIYHHRSRVIEKSQCFLDQLTLPNFVKDELSSFLVEMYLRALWWLTGIHMRIKTDPNGAEKISYFVDNMDWDNIGRIDSKKIVESYVSNKETIDSYTWSELCECCSEDYIRKFSKTLDWKEGRLRSDSNVRWYMKIYDTWPPEDIVELPEGRRVQDSYGFDDKDKNALFLFYDNESLPAVKYFWDKFTDADKSMILPEYRQPGKPGDISVYLLAQSKFADLPKPRDPLIFSKPSDLWEGLLCWPWVLFVDSWICKYYDRSEDKFDKFFCDLRRNLQDDRTENPRLVPKYYNACKEMWALCCQEFGHKDDLIKKIIGTIVGANDIELCKIVMNKSTRRWREIYLNGIRMYCDRISTSSQDFRDKFMEQILINDVERRILRYLIDQLRPFEESRNKLRDEFRRITYGDSSGGQHCHEIPALDRGDSN